MNLKSAFHQVVRAFVPAEGKEGRSRSKKRKSSATGMKFERLENRQLFATLNAGQVDYGWTNSPFEEDIYQFQASAGTQVELVTKAIPGSDLGFVPAARLYAPNGSLVRSFDANSGNQAFSLPGQTGIYTLKISDNDWSQRGTYSIGFETTRPASPDALSFGVGSVEFGSSRDRIEKDQFVFAARAGEVYEFVLRSTSDQPGYLAKLQVIGPTGVIKLNANGNSPSQRLPITETGSYIMMVSDDDLNQTGNYEIGLERVKPASPDALSIARGEVRYGGFRSITQKNQYVFYGVRGQVVDLVIRADSNSPGFVPTAFVYGPSGNVLKAFTQASGNVRGTLPETGNYIIQVFDNDLRQTGSYAIGMEGISPWSPDARLLARNSWHWGSLGDSLEKDQFVFSGSAGQVINMAATRQSTSPYFDPLIEVFNRAGQRVSWFRASTATKAFALPATGQYLIQISESGFDARGNYGFRWF